MWCGRVRRGFPGFGTKGSQVRILSPRLVKALDLAGEILGAGGFVLGDEIGRWHLARAAEEFLGRQASVGQSTSDDENRTVAEKRGGVISAVIAQIPGRADGAGDRVEQLGSRLASAEEKDLTA